MIRRLLPAILLAALVFALPAQAVQPNERLADPALEARARELSRGLRCLVCRNESIDESNADLARDLRLLVRERLSKGDTDAQVTAFLVARYGDYVLLNPPLKSQTMILWFTPLAALALGGIGAAVFLRRRTRTLPAAAPLTAEEQARLDKLLQGGPGA